jgi:thiol-disulfide isomerase/thioredoxin
MKKKLLGILLSVISLGGLTGCTCKCEDKKVNEDAIKFKQEYESFNNTKNEYFDYRTLSISEENPFIYSTDADIVKKIENKESFIVYFGDPECPWCRSVIEQAIKVAKENNFEKIYYVRFWNGFHKEVIRDVYELDEKNKPVLTEKDSTAYTKLLEYLDSVLKDYTLTDKKGNVIKVGEKRIFLPNFVAIENGVAKELVTGKSDKQTHYNGELTDEIINDEKTQFNEFFNKYKSLSK